MGSGAAALVREATDLVGLIGEVTHIKRAGSAASVMAMCPFHPNTDTPAMSVDGERGPLPLLRLWRVGGCADVYSTDPRCRLPRIARSAGPPGGRRSGLVGGPPQLGAAPRPYPLAGRSVLP